MHFLNLWHFLICGGLRLVTFFNFTFSVPCKEIVAKYQRKMCGVLIFATFYVCGIKTQKRNNWDILRKNGKTRTEQKSRKTRTAGQPA